jgi:hypothetical protein
VQIRHFARVELHVGPAHADAFNVDDHFCRTGDGWRDVFDPSDSGGGDHQGSHYPSFNW